MFDIYSSSINRLIIHRVIAKTSKIAAYAVYEESMCELNKQTEEVLKERLELALNKSNKTFKLEIEDIAENSFFDLSHKLKSLPNSDFISTSKKIADSLAKSHHRANIPGGFSLILDGYTKFQQHFIIVVKAEYQSAFSLTNNTLEILKDIFLSPAKDFYKIGVILEDSNSDMDFPNNKYSCFVYDDQYTLQNNDLTEYFYSNFLGFTTDRNSKLITKKFYDLTEGFANDPKNIDNIDDQVGLKNALRTLIREETSGIISPSDFSKNYLEGKLKEKFDKTVVSQFATSFVKDKSLLNQRLKLDRISIPLKYQLKLEGTSDKIKHSKIFNLGDKNSDYLTTTINTGEWEQIIVIGTIPQNEK
jgi:37-kD nucleoid-associated bacterial protein